MTSATLSEDVAFDVSGGIAVLELRRPHKRNAVSGPMWEAILAHLGAAAGRADVRGLVLQGSGGVFCAGADLGAVKDADPSASASFRELAVRAIEAVAALPIPTVARVEGPCIGGGCSLALACDLRFAHSGATFAIPAVRHGIVYDEESIARLVALVGPSGAARMLYTGVRLSGADAERIGLVDGCGEDLDGLVADCVEAIAAADPGTIAVHRALVRANAFPHAWRTEGVHR
jgi:enoyl-CoA hydratase/carnithine racemase